MEFPREILHVWQSLRSPTKHVGTTNLQDSRYSFPREREKERSEIARSHLGDGDENGRFDDERRGQEREREVVFDGALRILDRVEQRSASGSDGRSVYKLQTMALFPREKRDTTVK
ncbi:hypothetical protein K0M31_014763 [Melipona bicolor]|uniref:Uncharacterized protein n=1 Tax=Melipona bicolor TaxID=60889 RepID=A0AA40KFT8_9HYME|nr:hypothetical protein K0M31_014763 [Melipona bicolor]